MKTVVAWVLPCLVTLAASAALAAEPGKQAKRTSREALQAFNDLIGSWRATGTPEGTLQEKQKGFWTETVAWEWQFKGDDAWLTLAIDKGKYFTKGELRYLTDRDQYQLTLTTADKETLTFTGPLQAKRLLLERQDDAKKESQRLIVSLLHPNRFVYTYEVKPQEKVLFTRKYQVGCTKEGVAFATGDNQPECIVSGGLGKIPVMHNGQTYYVCCSGCRDAFKDDPEKWIKEYKERKAQEAKAKGR